MDSCTRSRDSIENVEDMKMSYELLQSITDNFSEKLLLGSGTFGKVYKGTHRNGKEIAVKVLRDMAALDDKDFKNEFQNLVKLDHQNIVQLVGYCNESEDHIVEHNGRQVTAEKLHVALCFEYIDNGSLNKYISDENEGLPWHIRYKIIKGICEGLKHLHKGLKTPVLHLDLKPHNILLDKEMVPKIADFGLSRIIGDERTRQTINKNIGTGGYVPPEYMKFQLLSPAFDIFSLGVIITKIMVGKEQYHDIADMPPRKLVNLVYNNWKKRLQEIVRPRSLEAYCHQVKECIKVASKCLMEDRHGRPRIEEIMDTLNDTEMISIPSAIEEFEESRTSVTMVGTSEGDREGSSFSYAKNKLDRPCVMEKYSYELLRKITYDFSEHRLLGIGAYGKVYKGVSEDGEVMAVKVLHETNVDTDEQYQNEIECRANLQHENITQLLGYCYETENRPLEYNGRIVIVETRHRALCLQYMQNGSLQNHITDASHGLDWCTRYKIIKGTCDGLRYLHERLPRHILHLGLKPDNILLDENMVPKITDFGDSRLFGEERTNQILAPVGTRGYQPPEYIDKGVISTKFDIYSLGVVVVRIVSGMSAYSLLADMTSQDFIKLVVGEWRTRLQATLKGRLLEGYCQQVTKCVEIALNCLERDRHKRPNIGEVVCMLDETETVIHDASQLLHVHPMVQAPHMDDNEMISIPSAIEEFEESRRSITMIGTSEGDREASRFSYAKNKLDPPCVVEEYSFEFLRKITNNFSEDRLIGHGAYGSVYKGVCEDGQVIAVKVLNEFYVVDEKYPNEIECMSNLKHENIMQLLGYCDETENIPVEYNGRIVMAERRHKALFLQYMKNGSLQNHITDVSHGLDWCTRYKIIKGTCNGLRYLHERLPSRILHLGLKPDNILLDENMVPKIADFGESRLASEERSIQTMSQVGTIGYLPPEYINKQVISTMFDIFSLGVIVIKVMSGMSAYYSLLDDMTSQHFIELVVEKWRNRLQSTLKGRLLEGYCQQVKKCIEIALKCVEEDRHKRPNIGEVVRMLDETETTIHNGGQLLHVHPMELCFPFKPKKYASSLLHLCNKEDDHVAFRLVSKSPKRYHTNLPLHGIVPPRCTCTIALTTSKQPQHPPPSDCDEGFDLQSMAVSCHQQLKLLNLDQASAISEYECIFKEAQESAEDEVQEVTLKSIRAPPPDEEASSKLTRPEIEIITTLDARKVSSIEVHPTKPWIMTTHEGGNLRIWNYQTMANINPIEVPDEPVYVAKFIAREDWIVAGDANGWIHVSSSNESQEAMSFEAHNGQIMSLAVHPTESNVLSSSNGDNLIKLWQWDQYWEFENGSWECTRTFEGHSDKVSQVVFCDKDSSFASASWDGTVKIWNLSSDVCNTTLNGHSDRLLCVDYITGADRQHVITGSKDGTAQIWDLETKRCREYLQGHANHISAVYSHHEHQKLITGSLDGTVRIWDSITFRLENIIALNLGAVSDVGYIEELQRIVVGCHQGIAMMMIKLS